MDPVDVAVTATVTGWQTREVRLAYWPHHSQQPQASPRPSLLQVYRYWAARNGVDSADYDMRAFNSRIPMQRAWQRRRHALTSALIGDHRGRDVLNVGAGSGRLALDLPGSVSVDLIHAKLRYMRRYGANQLTTASIFALPFADASFDCVVCCEVVEHVPREPSPLAELVRLLRPGGRLVISTPDYGTRVWPAIERVYAIVQPNGYADEHITHYTETSLIAAMESLGMRTISLERLYRAILIASFELPASPTGRTGSDGRRL
jgi:ubiquinone/menaquinone biosynthesis C-methylase UbiE